MSNGKDCRVCVYDSVCADRKRESTIVDCCVPEAPLRAVQLEALRQGGVPEFIVATRVHVMLVKAKSKYWYKKQYAQ